MALDTDTHDQIDAAKREALAKGLTATYNALVMLADRLSRDEAKLSAYADLERKTWALLRSPVSRERFLGDIVQDISSFDTLMASLS